MTSVRRENGKHIRVNGKSHAPSKSLTSEGKIDWEKVHEQILERTAHLAWINEELSPEVLSEAWAKRAAQIARTVEEDDQGEQIELALVRLGREIYGLDVQYVFDIRQLEAITRVPRVPDWVLGVVNLRGRILSALDLKRFLGLNQQSAPAPVETEKRYLVVVAIPEMELALIVDEVISIETLPVSMIQEPSSAIRGIRVEYMRGTVVRDEGLISVDLSTTTVDKSTTVDLANSDEPENNSMMMILNLPALLSDKRLVIHEEIL